MFTHDGLSEAIIEALGIFLSNDFLVKYLQKSLIKRKSFIWKVVSDSHHHLIPHAKDRIINL